jgi:hypothetical protein
MNEDSMFSGLPFPLNMLGKLFGSFGGPGMMMMMFVMFQRMNAQNNPNGAGAAATGADGMGTGVPGADIPIPQPAGGWEMDEDL